MAVIAHPRRLGEIFRPVRIVLLKCYGDFRLRIGACPCWQIRRFRAQGRFRTPDPATPIPRWGDSEPPLPGLVDNFRLGVTETTKKRVGQMTRIGAG